MEGSVEQLEEYRAAALAFANVLRGIVKQPPATELAPGVPHSCAGCPIAETAGPAKPKGNWGAVDGWEIGPEALLIGPRGAVKKRINVPPKAREFMAAFDAGMY